MSYGEVWSARWNRQLVAAKCLHSELFHNDQEIIDHYTQEFKKESEVLQGLIHPNIIRLFTVLFPPRRSPVIVTELLHCDLQRYIESSPTDPKVLPKNALSISLGIAEGLEYLHGLNPSVVHRDLATKNILLTADGHPKIADLGVAKVFAAGKDAIATVVPGTPLYAAPETYPIKKGLEFCTEVKYGVKVDIFSFGVVLLVIITGKEPTVWPLSPIKAGSKNTLIPERERRQKDINKMGNHRLKNLVLECIQDKSIKRPDASEVCKQIMKILQQLQSSSNSLNAATSSSSSLNRTEITHKNCIARNAGHTNTFEKVPRQPYYDYKFKVLFLGSGGVGKTCLIEWMKHPTYNISNTTSTIGIDIQFQSFKYNSSFVHMTLTDTAGQERNQCVQPMYLRDIHGVFLVYDVMREYTFEALDGWLNLVKQHCRESDFKVILVGNKTDCLHKGKKIERTVSNERALQFAKYCDIPYIETSVQEKDEDILMNMYEKMVQSLVEAVGLNDIKVTINDGQTNGHRVELCETKQPSKCRCKR